LAIGAIFGRLIHDLPARQMIRMQLALRIAALADRSHGAGGIGLGLRGDFGLAVSGRRIGERNVFTSGIDIRGRGTATRAARASIGSSQRKRCGTSVPHCAY